MKTIDAIQAVNDAAQIVAVLTPLIQRAMAAQVDEISDEEVDAARAAAVARIEEAKDLLAEAVASVKQPANG